MCSSLEANTVNMLNDCSCARVVGYLSTFEWENACAIYCFFWTSGKILHFDQYI